MPSSDRATAAPSNPVLAVATRGDRAESWHRGAVAVVHDGQPVLALGDVARPVFARSAIKPLQALPFLVRGLAERFGLADAELAVMCASHDGTAAHLAAVQRLLDRGGLEVRQLGCGPHAPLDPAARRALAARGERPDRLHNNCSGKHAGFLLLATARGDDPAGYLDPDGPTQREVAGAVAGFAGLDLPLPTGLDGCGAPTFALPLAALARAFCRLANPAALDDVQGRACHRILAAVGRAPELFAGERRLCTALVRTWPGACLPKNGAEGVYAVALAPDPQRRRWPGAVGIAVKVDDGAERGYQPVVVDLLRWLLALDSERLPPALAAWHRQQLRNTQDRLVGEVRCAVDWDAA